MPMKGTNHTRRHLSRKALHASVLFQELEFYLGHEFYAFHMPGHKAGKGAHPIARELLGQAAFCVDGADFDRALQRAQEEAARIFGADHSYFLINGSTAGNIAALLAIVHDGDKVLVFRDSHRSVFAGLTLVGAKPVYIKPVYDLGFGVYPGKKIEEIAALLEAEQDIKAIHVTRPSYYGLSFHLKDYVELAQQYHIPLLVDEAHGPHFPFHPALPTDALSQGADVVVQSTHKVLASLTQSSLLHVKSAYIDNARIEHALNLIQSTSPSPLLLLSLDIACTQMATEGFRLLDRTIELAEYARKQINMIDGLYCYGDELIEAHKVEEYDVTKLVVDVAGVNITGFEAAEWLFWQRNIGIELADLQRVVCTVTMGDTKDDIAYLINAFHELAEVYRIPESGRRNTLSSLLPPEALPEMVLTPHQALQASIETVYAQEATGRICAEYIIPYPPGIPLVIPGEVVSEELLTYITKFRHCGGTISGLADASMSMLRVVAREAGSG